MEVDNKNMDSANDSVESFEDAIDSLEITEELKPEKTEAKPEKTEAKPEKTEGNPEKTEATEQLKVLMSDTSTSKEENNDTTKSTDSKPSADSICVDDTTVSLESKPSELEVMTTKLEVKTSNGVVKPTVASNMVLSNENLSDVNSKQLKEERDPKASTEAVNSSNSIANNEEKPTPNNVESITTMLPDLVINGDNLNQNLSVNEQSICEVSDKKIEGVQNVSNVEIKKTVLENNLTKLCDKEVLFKDPAIEVIHKEPSPKTSKEATKENITPIDFISKEDVKETKAVELTKSEYPKKSPEKDATDSSLLQEENYSSNKNKSDTTIDDNKVGNGIRKEDGELNDDDDEDGSIKSEERECGDGQGEQDDSKKELDHDEDKRNPEYIPKKGSFYEHDTRTMDGFDDDVKKIEEETAARSKKKPKPVSVESRWSHDKYNELEQGPKSQQEIIDTYGYDIRNEEHAPKARRNRRYGRGPNKYNRNWEDEKAYLKVEKQPRPPGNRGPRQNSDRSGRLSGSDNLNHQQEREEFPPLARGENQGEKRSAMPEAAPSVDNRVSAENDKAGGFQYLDKIGMKAEKGAWVPPPPFSQKNVVNKINFNKNHINKTSNEIDKSPVSLPTNVSQKDSPPQSHEKPSPPKPKAFVPINNANFAPTNSPRTNFRPAAPSNVQQSLRGEAFPNGTKGARSRLPESGLIRPRANWEPNNWYINQKIENTGPPESPDLSNKDYSKLSGAGAVSLRGGKRYSVQRQQSLPDPARNPNSYGKDSPVPSTEGEVESPTAQQGTTQTGSQGGQTLTAYYHHATTGTAPPITVPQSSPSHLVFTQSPPPPTPAASIIKGDYVNLNIAGETPIYHSNSFQPAPVYTTEPTLPISNGGAAAPPMLLPVHFVSPPPNQVPPFNGNQAPIMNYAPQPMQYQPMQPIVSLPPPPQAEVFQPAGGITYYSPQTQAVLQRPALSKRVKSAIPIVPPNEIGNLMQQSLALQNNLLQQKQVLQQQHQVQVVPLEINKDESMSN
uniref:Protein CASC3 n=2 Tax=Cacopsylla melanoneura TaxID=428564 RepID=A0A8D8TU10_9HEMI